MISMKSAQEEKSTISNNKEGVGGEAEFSYTDDLKLRL